MTLRSPQLPGGSPQKVQNAAKSNSATSIPPWFLRDYVRTSNELKQSPPPLTIRGDGAHNPPISAAAPVQQGGYEMEAAFYESMSRIIRSTPQTTAASSTSNGTYFTRDAILLHYPNRSSWDNYGWRFLTCVVEYFAMTLGADLVTLTLDNIKALALHFAGEKELEESTSIDELVKSAFSTGEAGEKEKEKETSETTTPQHEPQTWFPFHAVLSAALVKSQESVGDNSRKLLIVHLPKVSRIHGAINGAILESLTAAVFKSQQQLYTPNVVFIATDIENPLSGVNPKIIKALGSNTVPKPLKLVPVNNEGQKALLKKDGDYRDPASAQLHRLANIREFQSAIRSQFPGPHSSSLLVSSDAGWEFLNSTRAGQIFEREILPSVDIDDMVHEIGESFTDADIEQAILRVGRREEVLDAWKTEPNAKPEASQEDADASGRWASFPPNIRKTIKEILGDKEKYKREADFLELVVNPDEVEDGWDDIALDPDTKEAIQHILPGMREKVEDNSDYGILRRGRIGGALLYGPPGTGKTHLARVVARECKAVTIVASGADIEDMYVGETEKIIKGLFNLGKMLVPSIIFIDEADALFRAREPGERSWKRSQTNQLLSEMDGLSKSKSAPFVLLATNFPNDLDHALLRRVPSRIYIGLPSAELRETILSIMLKEERLGPDLELARLAAMTRRFSGSDIQSLCVQAALICNSFIADGKDKGKRQLEWANFAKALKRVSPTASRKALALIKQFASDFDPPGYEKILYTEAREGEP
ncbi:P-loop containing nucleoside triphosphate hydrolase protein [Xylariales sp. PMI_506]|nr:P-loop containing nucleoside triphosphate hydrolase protein [Xylariales sp. PMI_506]